MNNIGDILRKARLKKELSFDDVVEKTGIPPHYLLTMELDQLQFLPSGSVNDYLEKYALAVDLDPLTVIHGYRNQEVGESVSYPSHETNSPLTEPYYAADFEENLELEKTPITVPNQGEQTDEFTTKSSISELETKATEQVSTDDDLTNPYPSRLSRYNDRDEEVKEKKSLPWLFILSIILALSILAYLGYKFYTQQQANTSPKQPVVTTTSTTKSQETTKNQVTLSTDFEQGGDTVTLHKVDKDVNIELSLVGQADSWVSLTNTSQGEVGKTLTTTDKTLTATLTKETPTSVITISLVDQVDVKIAGQKLDLTPLATSGLVSVNVVIE